MKNYITNIELINEHIIITYNNKYIKMAKRLNKKYKCTVICSSNPFDGNNPLDNAFTVIENIHQNLKIIKYII